METPASPWKTTDPDKDTEHVTEDDDSGRLVNISPYLAKLSPDVEAASATSTALPAPELTADTGEFRYHSPDTYGPAAEPHRMPEPGHPCPTCGAIIMTDPELLHHSTVLLTHKIGDVVPEMYRRLFTAAPSLIPLFEDHTPDLIVWVTPPNSPNRRPDEPQPDGTYQDGDGTAYWWVNPAATQVARLFGGIKAVVALFDPDDDLKMDRLRSALNTFARSHLRFDPPPSRLEYAIVGDTVASVLADFAGDAWTARLDDLWRRALDFVCGTMLAAQATARTTGPGRRRRTV